MQKVQKRPPAGPSAGQQAAPRPGTRGSPLLNQNVSLATMSLVIVLISTASSVAELMDSSTAMVLVLESYLAETT